MHLIEEHKQLILGSITQVEAKELLEDVIQFYKVRINGEEQWITTSNKIAYTFKLNNRSLPSRKAGITNYVGLKSLAYKVKGKGLHRLRNIVKETKGCERQWAFTPKAVLYIGFSLRDNPLSKSLYKQVINKLDTKQNENPYRKRSCDYLDALEEECINKKVYR